MMTADEIAAMKADMEAGTPGPWRVGPVDDTRVEASDGSEVAQIDGDYNEPDLWPIMEANARRIARVPAIEGTIIEQAERIAALEAEISDLKTSVRAFGFPWAAEYASIIGLPDGHLHPGHYDILKAAGARMDAFTRAAIGDAP